MFSMFPHTGTLNHKQSTVNCLWFNRQPVCLHRCVWQLTISHTPHIEHCDKLISVFPFFEISGLITRSYTVIKQTLIDCNYGYVLFSINNLLTQTIQSLCRPKFTLRCCSPWSCTCIIHIHQPNVLARTSCFMYLHVYLAMFHRERKSLEIPDLVNMTVDTEPDIIPDIMQSWTSSQRQHALPECTTTLWRSPSRS